MTVFDVPEMMQAIEIREPGGPDVLTPVDRPVPQPGNGQLLIKVSAAGVNRPDVIQRLGHYPPPPGASDLPGLEVSGVVVRCGEGASRYQIGAKVCALVSGGGYSQYCLADEGATLPVPRDMSDIAAAGIPETVFTVWHNVFERGALKAGEWFLVHGGASGIATTAIQLARAKGAKILTTVSSEEKADLCEKLGAFRAINYLSEDFPSVAREVTGGHGVDVILDMIGGDYIEKNIVSAAEDGRIVQIAFLKGATAEINFSKLMVKRLTLTGSTLRPRSKAFKAQLAKEVEKNVWPMIERQEFSPVIDSTFPMERAADAHRRMESRGHSGKIILTV